MLHPISAHFAIVLPFISLIIALVYLKNPSELMSKISTRFILFSAIFLIIAFFTGKNDGGEVYIFLSNEGQLLLKEHKTFGLYLAIAMGIVAIIKLVGCFKKIFKAEILATILLVAISMGIFYQGKMGGELTYTYGAHVKNHSDGMECLDDPQEFLEEEDD